MSVKNLECFAVETGEGGVPPFPPDGGRAPVLRTIALPVSPSPKGDVHWESVCQEPRMDSPQSPT